MRRTAARLFSMHKKEVRVFIEQASEIIELGKRLKTEGNKALTQCTPNKSRPPSENLVLELQQKTAAIAQQQKAMEETFQQESSGQSISAPPKGTTP